MFRYCAQFLRPLHRSLSLTHVIVDAGMTFETMFFGHSMLVPVIHFAKPVGPSIVSSLLHLLDAVVP